MLPKGRLVYALTLDGVGDAVALNNHDAVVNVLDGVGIVHRPFFLVQYPLSYFFAVSDDAYALRVERCVAIVVPLAALGE